MQEKKYTEDHEWIELSEDGKTGNLTLHLFRFPRPIERPLMPSFPQAPLGYLSSQRTTSVMLSLSNYPQSEFRYQPATQWGLSSRSNPHRIS